MFAAVFHYFSEDLQLQADAPSVIRTRTYGIASNLTKKAWPSIAQLLQISVYPTDDHLICLLGGVSMQ